jgi:dimethylglycine dehydrogenase
VRESVGLWETSAYCKIEIAGAGSAAWLDGMLANRIPAEVGSITLCPMLTPRGRILGDVTLVRVEPERFLMFGSPSAESYYLRWFAQQLRPQTEVTVRSRTLELCGFCITGPRARELLAAVTSADVSASGLPFLRSRSLVVGLANTLVMRLSFAGELGYEIYMPADEQRHVYETLLRAGAACQLRHFGLRALNALRLEKGYGTWGREYSSDYTPDEACLSRFVKVDKGAFVGRDAVLKERSKPLARRLTLLAIDSSDPDPVGGEPIIVDGQPLARLTSAAFGHTVGYALGFAYLPPDLDAQSAPDIRIQVLSRRLPARILREPPYDPQGLKLRA